MTRRFCFLLLLANTSIAMAQPLYKWVEADGSITFSPQPPPQGTPYEAIKSESAPTVSAQAPASSTEQGAEQQLQTVTENERTQSIEASSPSILPKIQYAPERATNALEGNRQNSRTSSLVGSTGNLAIATTSGSASTPSAASYKQSRCEDLSKRVTSLEQRMKSRLTPEDMDNTVVHMARYQRSYDQYCVQ